MENTKDKTKSMLKNEDSGSSSQDTSSIDKCISLSHLIEKNFLSGSSRNSCSSVSEKSPQEGQSGAIPKQIKKRCTKKQSHNVKQSKKPTSKNMGINIKQKSQEDNIMTDKTENVQSQAIEVDNQSNNSEVSDSLFRYIALRFSEMLNDSGEKRNESAKINESPKSCKKGCNNKHLEISTNESHGDKINYRIAENTKYETSSTINPVQINKLAPQKAPADGESSGKVDCSKHFVSQTAENVGDNPENILTDNNLSPWLSQLTFQTWDENPTIFTVKAIRVKSPDEFTYDDDPDWFGDLAGLE